MKKVGIITIIDDNNYGNRLQNYAVQETIKKFGFDCCTLKNQVRSNKKGNFLYVTIVLILKTIQNFLDRRKRINRYNNFNKFNKKINFYKKTITSYNAKKFDKVFDYFLTGSDQIWNVSFRRSTYIDMLEFTNFSKRIAFSPSFGVSSVPNEFKKDIASALKEYKALSVREDAGKEIIESLIDRQDIQVLVDPTMLLTDKEWDKVAKKPEMLTTDKYILNYFLGSLSPERQKEIERIASDNNCMIINLLDKNDSFYNCGPSEFLYLEKHAFLICTDSFHSSVFAVLYNRPFIIFDREDHLLKMNSRIETLLSKFKLKNREYNGKNITEENINHDYTEAYNILDRERKIAFTFLKNALDIEENPNE